MVKKILQLFMEFLTYEGPFDSVELCGWQKCPVPEKKQIIQEDYSI
jgi:hypothetical protein